MMKLLFYLSELALFYRLSYFYRLSSLFLFVHFVSFPCHLDSRFRLVLAVLVLVLVLTGICTTLCFTYFSEAELLNVRWMSKKCFFFRNLFVFDSLVSC